MSTKPSPTVPQHHYVRTIVAAILGSLSLLLIIASLLIVWLNRTLTDTGTFVQTVSPLVSQPAVQTFIIQKATDKVLESAPPADLAQQLLPAGQATGQTEDQLRTQLRPVLAEELRSVIGTPQFATLWHDTVQSAHSQLLVQIKAGETQPTLDFTPALSGAVDQLKASKLAPIAEQLEIPAGAGIIKLEDKDGIFTRAKQSYDGLQQASLTVAAAAIVLLILAVLISVHHRKTLRRILVITGGLTLLLAAALQAPAFITPQGDDAVTQAAALAIAGVLLHNLQVASLVLGVGCISLAIVTKLTEKFKK